MPERVDTLETNEVETAVLNEIRSRHEARPLDLLNSLSERYSTADLKIALAELLHEGQIELTPARVLRAAA